jgi:peptidoglycan/xylan/chitin deacetylase (PgdA/CDA1 family)
LSGNDVINENSGIVTDIVEGFWSLRIHAWRLTLLSILGALFIVLVMCTGARLVGEQQNTKLLLASEQYAAQLNQGFILGASTMRDFNIQHPYKPVIYHSTRSQQALPAGPIAQVVYRVQTSEPVIFITIDDGVTPDPQALRVMRENHIVASLFLYDNAVWRHYDYFRLWQKIGATVENHTISHAHLPRLPFPSQKQEICGNADRMASAFGSRPTLFRPPYGEFNAATQRAAAECGAKALIWWSATVQDGALHYQGTGHLKPGDIVLLHFTPKLANDLHVLLRAAATKHLQIGKLEEWLH